MKAKSKACIWSHLLCYEEMSFSLPLFITFIEKEENK